MVVDVQGILSLLGAVVFVDMTFYGISKLVKVFRGSL